jgi:hypothetical protein
MQKLPLGQGSAEKIVMRYPSEGGASPGDTWDLYIGPDGRIQEFALHRGGTANPPRNRELGRHKKLPFALFRGRQSDRE